MKVRAIKDEWYPVYDIDPDPLRNFGKQIEVDDPFMQRYIKMMEEFNYIQQELKKLYEPK